MFYEYCGPVLSVESQFCSNGHGFSESRRVFICQNGWVVEDWYSSDCTLLYPPLL